jgi:hypothetical protein
MIGRGTCSGVLALGLLAGGCLPGDEPLPGSAASSSTAALDDELLERGARQLARELADAPLRAGLRALLAQRKTGDHEVLLEEASALLGGDGRPLGQALAGSGLLAHAGRIHIAAPRGVADWSPTELPLVSYVPTGAEEEAEELVYFDAQGERQVRPGGEPPAQPVLFLGINERADYRAADRIALQDEIAAGPFKRLQLGSARIFADHEPWFKGSPEIYLECGFAGAAALARINLSAVDEVDRLYALDIPLINYYRSYGNPMICAVLEEDGGNLLELPIEVTYQGVTVRVTLPIRDGDDRMGHNAVNYDDPTPTLYHVGDAAFQLAW